MNRIEEEKRVVELMIRLYCRKKEGNDTLCEECSELIRYAHVRLGQCRFGNGKPACKRCPIHCYKRDMRERIRAVMRYSGPRLILYHPLPAIRYMIRKYANRAVGSRID